MRNSPISLLDVEVSYLDPSKGSNPSGISIFVTLTNLSESKLRNVIVNFFWESKIIGTSGGCDIDPGENCDIPLNTDSRDLIHYGISLEHEKMENDILNLKSHVRVEIDFTDPQGITWTLGPEGLIKTKLW